MNGDDQNTIGHRARDRSGAIAFMARNGVAANLLMIFMVIAGLFSYSKIVQEVFPESSLDTVSVSMVYPGATPAEIEESIIQRIEEAVEAVDGIKKITATASEGIGTVNVELDSGADIASALDEIKAEVDQIQTFPDAAEEPEIRELTNRQVVMRIALFGNVSEPALKQAALILEDAISTLPEVSYVQTGAVRDYQIHIDVPQNRLRALNLSLTDVSRAVAANSLDSPAGSVDTASEEVRIRTLGQNYSQQDFEDIVIKSTSDGALLRLGDISSITDGFEDNNLIARFNDKPVAFVDVYRTSDERVLDVAAAVKEMLIESYQPPNGIEYAVWDDNSEVLNDRLGLLLNNAAIGLLLVLISLTLFLDLRLACWTAVGIGVTFVGAVALLELAGSSINMFSLFGFILALGLVVDDAVVVGENIYAERERGRSGLGAAIAGTQRVKIPVIFAVLTTIVAAMTLLSVGGAIGKVVADVPVVVLAVLALSLVEALLVLPHHLSSLPAAGVVAGNNITRFFESVQSGVDLRLKAIVDGPLDRALRFSVRFPLIVLSLALSILLILIALLPAGIIKFSFFPDIESDFVTASIEMPSGTTIDHTAEVAARVEAAGDRALARYVDGNDQEKMPEFFRASYTTVGLQQSTSGSQGVRSRSAPNIADVQIALTSASERDVSAFEFEQAWREELGSVPEASSLQFVSSNLSLGAAVNVQIFDTDPKVLQNARLQIMQKLSQINGVLDIESDQDSGMQEIELRLKPGARTFGVTLQDVASQVRAAFFGAEAVRVQRGREDVRVYVRLPEGERNSIVDVERFWVRVAGGFVPLSSLADAQFTEAPSQINRRDGRRVVTISGDVDESIISGQEVTGLLDNEILSGILSDYPTLQYEFGGQQEEQRESFGDLGGGFAIALVTIYALLAIAFRSYSQPLIIMSAIPFGFIGALLAHVLLDIPLGILSLFGITALSGVIINGSLVLIDFLNENLAAGMSPKEAVIDAAKSRFRPIMLTAITTFLGVAPITFETSRQAQFLIPMSASLGFGVLVGTALLMLVVPALAILHMQIKAKLREWAIR